MHSDGHEIVYNQKEYEQFTRLIETLFENIWLQKKLTFCERWI